MLQKNKMKLDPSKCASKVTLEKFLGFMVRSHGVMRSSPTRRDHCYHEHEGTRDYAK